MGGVFLNVPFLEQEKPSASAGGFFFLCASRLPLLLGTDVPAGFSFCKACFMM